MNDKMRRDKERADKEIHDLRVHLNEGLDSVSAEVGLKLFSWVAWGHGGSEIITRTVTRYLFQAENIPGEPERDRNIVPAPDCCAKGSQSKLWLVIPQWFSF